MSVSRRPDPASVHEMSVLRSLETKIAGLVEGTFGRVFRSEVRPVELARKLAREMESTQDDLAVAHLRAQRVRRLALARPIASASSASSRRSSTSSAPTCSSTRAASGSRCVVAAGDRVPDRRRAAPRRVRDPGPAGRRSPTRTPRRGRVQADHGHTMVYSAGAPVERARAGARRIRAGAILEAEGKRLVIGTDGAVIGRSRDVRRRARRRQRLAPPRRDPPDVRRLVDGRRPGFDQRRQGQRPARSRARQSLEPGDRLDLRHRRDRRSRCSDARARRRRLKFGFLAVLYLFLLWVSRSALKDLRRGARRRPIGRAATPAADEDATGMYSATSGRRGAAALEPRLVVERAAGLHAGDGVRPRRRRGARPRRPGRDPPRRPVRVVAARAPDPARAASSCSRISARRTGPTSTRSC